MEEQVISFETAKLAKEKGFNIKTLFAYNLLGVTNNSFKIYRGKDFDEFSNTFCFTPTQSLLQKWLREEHNLHIELQYGKINKYYYLVFKNDVCEFSSCISLNYEEALEIGLLEALKLI